uniref:pyridoxal kinase n=1 Tax=Tetradesmus obliquus TaxID=3088 RepID=A0A383WI31_TETOB|eukprot:jgi/Sobl393_1/8048/SZX77110.1
MSHAAAAAATVAEASSSFSSPRVLSIQSSVVHGYVGNKAAVFPLQLLGFDVDPVYTVQFSNHTGYPVIKGHVFDGGHLRELLAGLATNGLICHTHLLSGYIGSQSLLEAVAAVAGELRSAYPQLTYVCDPVLGDEGKLYVSQELVAAYKASLLPLANILTPNQFEAELLTGLEVKSEEQALQAAAALHDMGPHTVIITSLASLPHPEYSSPRLSEEVSGQPAAAIAAAHSTPQQQQQEQTAANDEHQQQQQQQRSERYITLIASTRVAQAPGCPAAFRMRIPKLQGYFTGTGDLLCALLLAWSHRYPDNLAAAVEHAVAGLQGVLQLTAAAAGPAVLASTDERSAAVFRAKELRLVQGQQQLLQPDIKIRVEPITL